ncbi:c-type cytochrome [Novosphingobium sp.]|uniref:c-type cytochrome n=1 Tax=Novosphingobium sp. TaxID=1874826 RepID=UPI00286D1052|nr:c-type cytochrome [Novosphingobium sp.]
MRKTLFAGSIAALALMLAGCGKPAEEKATGTESGGSTTAATSASADARPAAFAQCAACHAVKAGKHGVGPSLAGVFGTKAGDVPGYAFSDPMKASGLIWDEQTLDSYLTNPMKMVPGTRMTYYGMSDPADRKAVIDYLKTLK